MYVLAFGLEMVSTFTIVTRLPPSRTFLSAFLMLVTTEVTVNFHTFVAFAFCCQASYSVGLLDHVS